MYVPRAVACSVANGELPLAPQAIAAPQQRRAALDSVIQTAQAGFDRAINRLERDFDGMSKRGLYRGGVNWPTPPGNLRIAPWPWGAGSFQCLSKAPLPPGYESLRPIQVNPLADPAPAVRAAAAAGCPAPGLCACLEEGPVLPSALPTALAFECASGRGVAVTAPAEEARAAAVETGSGSGLAGLTDYFWTSAAIFSAGLGLLLFGPKIEAALRKRGL